MNYLTSIQIKLTVLLWATVSFLVFSNAVRAANLLHHWKLDEASGSSVADSVGSANMTIAGINTGWITGQESGAFSFDGTNHAETLSQDAVTTPTSSVAIAGWFKTSTSLNRFVFQFERMFEMRHNDGQIQLSFNSQVGSAPKWSSGLNDGLWHHFVAQNTGGTTELYIDGVLVGTRNETLGSLDSESKQSALASKQSGQSEFAGALDDVRYYDASLTLQGIQQLAMVSSLPPTANDDAYTMAEDAILSVSVSGVLANDTEPDGDIVTALLEADIAVGSLTLNADGSFTYTPQVGYSGVVTFTYYAVDDAEGASDTPATVTITVVDASTSLTPEEISQIESDLGITLSAQDVLDLAAIVKPQTLPTWRSDANARIETHRKANLSIVVVDSMGTPVPGAEVSAQLRKSDFKFGGVLTVMDLTDADANLSSAGSGIAQWKQVVKSMFNAVGFNNGFKPKITGQHTYIPSFLTWAESNDLDVRGHLLMWPGGGTLEDLDNPSAVAGVDYGNHLTTASTSAYASYNVLGAVDTYKSSARDQAAKDALESVVDAEILEWVSQWDVYEWDVVNETIGNRLLQEILGYEEMAEWFKIANANKRTSVYLEVGLFINDFQVISADHAVGSTRYESRKDTYFERIDKVVADGGQITGVGFQSRFNYGHIPAEIVYSRLDEFATRYPAYDLAGTEFEMKDRYDDVGDPVNVYGEYVRAQMTEEILTTYYSHDQVTGMNAWDVMKQDPVIGDDLKNTRAMFYYGDGAGGVDGMIAKLNALVWYYLHRIRYTTDVSDTSDSGGGVIVPGHKGEYDITVSYLGNDYPVTYHLLADGSTQVVLHDVTLAPTTATLEHWLFDDAANVELEDALNSEGMAAFVEPTASTQTDGNGALKVTQHPLEIGQWQGDFIPAEPLSFGARNTGTFEIEFVITSADLSSGDANGASIGFGLKDSSMDEELFMVRMNKTTNGLAVSTYIDTTYTQLHVFSGQYILTQPIKVRSVVDLDAGAADVYLTVGNGLEEFKQQVSLSSIAVTWDQVLYAAQNNQTDWGATDSVTVDYLRIRKLDLDHYTLWQSRTAWGIETLQAATDNPDGDELDNFLEYALGGDPLVKDSTAFMPTVAQWSNAPHYTFTLGVDSVDVTYVLQHSEDLTDWNSLPVTRVHGQAGELVRIPLLNPDHDSRFSRLSVSQE